MPDKFPTHEAISISASQHSKLSIDMLVQCNSQNIRFHFCVQINWFSKIKSSKDRCCELMKWDRLTLARADQIHFQGLWTFSSNFRPIAQICYMWKTEKKFSSKNNYMYDIVLSRKCMVLSSGVFAERKLYFQVARPSIHTGCSYGFQLKWPQWTEMKFLEAIYFPMRLYTQTQTISI